MNPTNDTFCTTGTSPTNQIALAARAALEAGYQPVPVEPRGKKPAAGVGWEQQRYAADQPDLESIFTANHNIGLLLGPSKLVDADLDSTWARTLADAFLPRARWSGVANPSRRPTGRTRSPSR